MESGIGQCNAISASAITHYLWRVYISLVTFVSSNVLKHQPMPVLFEQHMCGKWLATSSKAYTHEPWGVHIGRASSTSTNDRQHQPSLVCLREATSSNRKWYFSGLVCRRLTHKSNFGHTLNQRHAWTVCIGCQLCTSIRDCYPLTSPIALGLHTKVGRCQTWAALISQSLHIA